MLMTMTHIDKQSCHYYNFKYKIQPGLTYQQADIQSYGTCIEGKDIGICLLYTSDAADEL